MRWMDNRHGMNECGLEEGDDQDGEDGGVSYRPPGIPAGQASRRDDTQLIITSRT